MDEESPTKKDKGKDQLLSPEEFYGFMVRDIAYLQGIADAMGSSPLKARISGISGNLKGLKLWVEGYNAFYESEEKT